ncbi:MAG: M16 family metallopeptidase [Flavobacteriales bacterium]
MLNRSQAPALHPIEHIGFIQPEIIELTNGASIFWRNGINNETSKIELHFKAGSSVSTPIIASLCAGLLISGTTSKSARQIQKALDALGAYYDVTITQNEAIVSLYALKDQLLSAYTVFHESLFNASFPIKELQDLIAERRQKFMVQQEKVSFLAQRQFQRSFFAGSSYAQQIQLEDYDAVAIEEIKAFHSEHYLNGLLEVLVIGDLETSHLQELQNLLLQFKAAEKHPEHFTWQNEIGAIHIEQEGALQSALRIGRPLFNKTHPDFCDFSILNTILGDYFGSRLMSNIREDKGFTYGIGSYLVEHQSYGYFVIGTEVGVQTRIATFEEIQKEFDRLKNEEVPQEELDLVKNYMLGQLLKSADGPYAMLDLFSNVHHYGLTLEFYDHLIERIRNITPQRIQELAKRYLNWEEMLIISAG